MSIRKGAALLGVAGLIEYGLQLLLPVILVRFLDPEAFGDYRLVWLLGTTALAVFPMFVPGSLFHFLPRATAADRPAYLCNAWVFVMLGGVVAAALLLVSWSWLPSSVAALRQYSGLVPLFLALWVGASLLDVLPTADGRARWQAGAMVALAVLRTAMLGFAAVLAADGATLLAVLCAFAAVKLLLVPAYAASQGLLGRLRLDPALMRRQFLYSLPFAVGNALYLLRVQADQWIVASFFSSSVFALISIAGIALAVSGLVRQPLNNAVLPRLSALLGAGRNAEACQLLARSYAALSLVLAPLLGMFFVAARELVILVYTPAYVGAAPMMQVYLVGQLIGVFAAGHLLVVAEQGRLSTTISAVCLVVSIVLSLVGVRWFGPVGAVAGSVVSLLVGEVWALLAVTRKLGAKVSDIVNLRVSGRVIAVVVLAACATLLVRTRLPDDWGAWPTLFAIAAVYAGLVLLGGWVLGILSLVRPLLAGLRGDGSR